MAGVHAYVRMDIIHASERARDTQRLRKRRACGLGTWSSHARGAGTDTGTTPSGPTITSTFQSISPAGTCPASRICSRSASATAGVRASVCVRGLSKPCQPQQEQDGVCTVMVVPVKNRDRSALFVIIRDTHKSKSKSKKAKGK